MPEGDGIELLNRLRETRADLPIVVMSGGGKRWHALPDLLQAARLLGSCCTIEKPFGVREFFAIVDALLNKKAGA